MITFTELIDLLAKNRLYISDSGVIAKYGKSKTEGNLSFGQQMFSKFASFFTRNLSSIVWFGIYLVVSVLILLGMVLSSEREGWQRFAYGVTGPLLSFNCVLILLVSLKGFAYSLRGNVFIVRVSCRVQMMMLIVNDSHSRHYHSTVWYPSIYCSSVLCCS